jgi:hypothetical protein
MLDIHPLTIFYSFFIQPSFKFTIRFVRPNMSPTNLITDLKMRWIGDEFNLYHFS